MQIAHCGNLEKVKQVIQEEDISSLQMRINISEGIEQDHHGRCLSLRDFRQVSKKGPNSIKK